MFLIPTLGFSNSKQNLFKLINQRLFYAQDVAIYKFNNHKDIADYERENAILEASNITAKDYNLDTNSLKNFIQAQMNANKAIQYRNFANWTTNSVVEKKVDLKNIRNELDKLNKQILQNISKNITINPIQQTDYELFSQIINVDNLNENDKKYLFNALKNIKLKKD